MPNTSQPEVVVFEFIVTKQDLAQAHFNDQIQNEADLLGKMGESSTRRRSSPDVGIQGYF
jgi:hypothetical protein